MFNNTLAPTGGPVSRLLEATTGGAAGDWFLTLGFCGGAVGKKGWKVGERMEGDHIPRNLACGEFVGYSAVLMLPAMMVFVASLLKKKKKRSKYPSFLFGEVGVTLEDQVSERREFLNREVQEELRERKGL
jgi:hypothetical protein